MTTCSGSNSSSTRPVGRGSNIPRWFIDSLATGGPALVLADAVAKATIFLCVTTAFAALLRRSAAAVRHRLWSLTLCGLIVLPFLSWWLPGWRLPILPRTAGLRGSAASWNEGAAESRSNQGANAGAPDSIHSMPSALPRPGRPEGRFGSSARLSPAVQSLVAPGEVQRESARMTLLWALGFLPVARASRRPGWKGRFSRARYA
jgi:hypothetical protein